MGCKLLPIPLSDIRQRSFSSTVSVCNLLNILVTGGKLFCSTVTVVDHFPRIVSSLVKHKVSGGQEQEQVSVAMEFTVQVSTFC